MQLEVENRVTAVFGLRKSGKSTWGRWILREYGELAIVYDTLHEYPDGPYDSYRPQDRYSVDEYERATRAIMSSRRYSIYTIDESNRYNPSKPSPLPQATADLNDWCRHEEYQLGCIHIARRPVQLNQDITELADNLIIFQLRGLNDIKYLDGLSAGLGNAVSQLPPFHFVLVNPDRSFQVCPPVPFTKSDEFN
jgi:hypothetical protein